MKCIAFIFILQGLMAGHHPAYPVVYEFNFEENAADWAWSRSTNVWRTSSNVISGNYSLYMNSLGLGDGLHDAWLSKSDQVELINGNTYQISFKYFLSSLSEGNYLVMRLQNSYGSPGWMKKLFYENSPEGVGFEAKSSIYIPDDGESYRILFSLKGEMEARIDDVKIRLVNNINPRYKPTAIASEYEPYGCNAYFNVLTNDTTMGYEDSEIVPAMQQLGAAGIQWIRVGVPWRRIEWVRNSYHSGRMARLDYIVEKAADNNLKISFTMSTVPPWASEGATDSQCLDLDYLQDWEDFVGYIGARYSNDVFYYEIGNEPDGGSWGGELTNFYEYVKSASVVLRSINPGNRIVLGGFAHDGAYHYWETGFAKNYAFQKLYDFGIRDYFDIAAMHVYINDPDNHTVRAAEKINNTFEVMRSNGDGAKKIWITETGSSRVWHSEADQAVICSNIFDETIAHPAVDKVFWFRFRDCDFSGDDADRKNNFGLVDWDFNPYQAYTTLSNLAKCGTTSRWSNWNMLAPITKRLLKGYYKMDEGGGVVVSDKWCGNHAVSFGAEWVSDGKTGKALRFDGINDYVEITNSATLHTLENIQEGDYTICAWIKPSSIPPLPVNSEPYGNQAYYIIGKKGWGTGLLFKYDQKLEMSHLLDGNTYVTAVSSSSVNTGEWIHVAGVVSRSAGKVELYLNGELQGAATFLPGAAAREYNQEPWRIGIHSPGAASQRFPFHGSIDEVRIYNNALQQEDINAIYLNAEGLNSYSDADVRTDVY